MRADYSSKSARWAVSIQLTKNMKPNLFIGPAGWIYPDWKGIVYPSRMPSRQTHLDYLSRYFNLVEVNSSFYRLIDEQMTANWLEQVKKNASFQFTCKLLQNFTHQRDVLDRELAIKFKAGIRPLLKEDRLLSLLIQFPWSFKNSEANRDWLLSLFELFGEFPLSLEVRHKSWDEPGILKMLSEHNVAFANIDQPEIGDASLGFTRHAETKLVYVRFHGRNAENWFKDGAGRNARYDYLYSPGELDTFLDFLRGMIKLGKTIVLVYNNHFRGQAVANALQMQAELLGEKVAVPESLLGAYPQLKPIAKFSPQQGTLDLF